jgi:hypothetical protein
MLDQPAAAHPALKTQRPRRPAAVRGGGPNEKPGASRRVVGALTAAGVLGHDHDKSRCADVPVWGTVSDRLRRSPSRIWTIGHV